MQLVFLMIYSGMGQSLAYVILAILMTGTIIFFIPFYALVSMAKCIYVKYILTVTVAIAQGKWVILKESFSKMEFGHTQHIY